MTVVIGVDPGGRMTGAVIRHGDELLDFAVLERADGEPVDVFARRVVARTDQWVTEIVGGVPVVAVEDVVAPSGFRDGRRQFARPDSLITTLGAREKAGTGRLSHARSAWDIAAAGLSMSRGLR